MLCSQVIPAQVEQIKRLLQVNLAVDCNLLVGPSGSGKTTAWQVAQGVMERLHEANPDNPAYSKEKEDVTWQLHICFRPP